jgi:hypothetical protein
MGDIASMFRDPAALLDFNRVDYRLSLGTGFIDKGNEPALMSEQQSAFL